MGSNPVWLVSLEEQEMTRRDTHVETQDRGLWGTQPCRYPDLGLCSLQNCELINFCCLSSQICGTFFCGSLIRLIQRPSYWPLLEGEWKSLPAELNFSLTVLWILTPSLTISHLPHDGVLCKQQRLYQEMCLPLFPSPPPNPKGPLPSLLLAPLLSYTWLWRPVF